MDPAFCTVRTPRARTHQQQLTCYAHHVFNGRADSKKRMAHPACMNRYACWLLLLLLLLLASAGCCCCCCWLLLLADAHEQPATAANSQQQLVAAAAAASSSWIKHQQ
jgi:hypothetical protein